MCWFAVNSGSKGVVFARYQAIQNRNLIVLLDLLSLLDASTPGFKPFSFLIIFSKIKIFIVFCLFHYFVQDLQEVLVTRLVEQQTELV